MTKIRSSRAIFRMPARTLYSTDPAAFLGPVRVVGRLPDVVGANTPDYVVDLLDKACTWKTRPRTDCQKYFGLTAHVWRKSTELSIENLFNDASAMKQSPPSGPGWSASVLAPRFHFINCHGEERTPKSFGQKGSSFPASHYSPKLKSKIEEGTVVAAECCYGAQLSDPATPLHPRDATIPGIGVTYLTEGAYGVFGSTTIAYGPSEGNGQADYICRSSCAPCGTAHRLDGRRWKPDTGSRRNCRTWIPQT